MVGGIFIFWGKSRTGILRKLSEMITETFNTLSFHSLAFMRSTADCAVSKFYKSKSNITLIYLHSVKVIFWGRDFTLD